MPDLTFIGVAIIFVGFLIVMIATTMSGERRQEQNGEGQETHMKGGGVIMIGPIPIIFGSDAKWTSIAVVLAIVLIVVALLSGVLIRQ